MIQSVNEQIQILTSNSSTLSFLNDDVRSRNANCCGFLQHDEGSPLYKLLDGGVYDNPDISIREALNEINKSLGVKVDKAITSVPTENARYTVVDGYTTITSEDKIVTSEDILNCLQASIYNKIDERFRRGIC